jgi:hypothetical protein
LISGGGQVTPTTDTNGLGHCDTGTDACGASSEASDSAGHFGRALQAGGHSRRTRRGCRVRRTLSTDLLTATLGRGGNEGNPGAGAKADGTTRALPQ